MSLPYYAIKQRVTTIMVSLGIVFVGLIGAFSLQKEYFPRLTFPQVTVVTEYVNAAPEEIEALITRPLEEAISSTSGLRKLDSVSQEGKSMIFASFGWNENIDFAALSVREKIDLVKERLPKESEDPIVLKFDPLDRPVMMLSVTSQMHPADLKILTERILKENLEKVEGVASATVSGGLDREIQVELDQGRVHASEISILEVIDAIDNANISYPAGSIKKGLYEYMIRTVGEFREVPEIAYTVIASDVKKELKRQPEGFLERGEKETRDTLDTLRDEQALKMDERRLVFLRDIGTVRDAFRERSSISRYNAKENVSVSIQKQGSANAVGIANRIHRELIFLSEELESRGMNVEVIYDHSRFIKRAIRSVRDAAIVGGIIAAVVLFLFFRNWASALIVVLSMPISIMGTFFLWQLHGITMNMMSLGGLALAVGMMVDNSIVVIENIFRLREQGLSPEKASVQGTNDVFWPVFSSTLTTVAVFLPIILFVPGVAGQLFKDLSWTVIYTLALSLFVAMTLVPMLATYIDVSKERGRKAFAIPRAVGEKIKSYFSKQQEKQQNRVFLKIVGIGFGLFALSLIIFRMLDTEVIPAVDQGQFLVRVNLPVGSRLEATDEFVRLIEEEAKEMKEVKSVAVTIGSAKTSRAGEVTIETLRPYESLLTVELNERRRRSSKEVVDDLKERLERYDLEKAEIEYILQGSEFDFATGGTKPIEIEIKGYDLEKLNDLTAAVERLLQATAGVTEILSDVGEPSPETKVEIDRHRAALYAISARDISLTAKAGIEGAVATLFKEAGREIDVRVRLEEKDRENIRNIGSLLVYSNALEVPVALKDVASIKPGYGPSEIRRKDQIRTITVRAGIKKGFKEKKVLGGIVRGVKEMDVPNDYTVELVGKAREVRESFRRLAFAILLALILTYMIMAAQFESFLHPFVIMLTVPLAMIGVALALLLTGTAISVISLLGVLILAGTVVNNSIIIVDFINRSRREGTELVEACIDSVIVRLRPILSTTLTTVVGLLPLAIGLGEGAELQAPLAIAIIGGLTSGAFFTLCVIPSLYILVTRLVEHWFGVVELDEEL